MRSNEGMESLMNAKQSMRRLESSLSKYLNNKDQSMYSRIPDSQITEYRSTNAGSSYSMLVTPYAKRDNPALFEAIIHNSKLASGIMPTEYSSILPTFIDHGIPTPSHKPYIHSPYVDKAARRRLITQLYATPYTDGRQSRPAMNQEAFYDIDARPELSVYDRARGLYSMADRFDMINDCSGHAVPAADIDIRDGSALIRPLADMRHCCRRLEDGCYLSRSIAGVDGDAGVRAVAKDGKIKVKKVSGDRIGKSKKQAKKEKNKSNSKKKNSLKGSADSSVISFSSKTKSKPKKSKKRTDDGQLTPKFIIPVANYISHVTKPSKADVAKVSEEIKKYKAAQIGKMLGVRHVVSGRVPSTRSFVPHSSYFPPENLNADEMSHGMSMSGGFSLVPKLHLNQKSSSRTARPVTNKSRSSSAAFKKSKSIEPNDDMSRGSELRSVMPTFLRNLVTSVGEYTKAKFKESAQDKVNRIIRRPDLNPLANLSQAFKKPS